MGNTRPYDKDNPAAFTSPLQQKDGFDINVSEDSGGGTFKPNTFLPATPPLDNMHSIYQPCTQLEILETGGSMMADFMKPNSLQNPSMDPISKNVRSNMPRTCRVSDVPFPEWDLRGVPHYTNQDFMPAADNAMNGAGLSSIQSPPINFMLRRNAAGGYQMVRQGGEARSSNVNRSQMNGDFGTLGGSSYMLSHSQKSGQPQFGNHVKVSEYRFGFQENVNENFGSLGGSTSTSSDTQNRGHTQIGNNVKASEDGRGAQERIDGSFLSLGIGGNETRSKPKFSSREIANKLEEAVSPELNISHVPQTTRASSSLGQNLHAGIPSFQTNAGGFLNPMCSADGWTLSNNDVEAMCSANSGPGSSPFQVMQRPPYAMQHNISTLGNRNSSFVSNRNVVYTELDPYRALRSNQAGLSGALDSNSAGFLSSRQVNLPGLASESAKPALIPTRTPSDMLHNLYVLSAQKALESSMNSPSLTLSGSSTRSNQAGPLFTGLQYSGSQAAETSRIPQIAHAQPPGHLLSDNGIAAQAAGGSLFPQRIGVPIAASSAAKAATSGLFPKRLGVDVNVNGGPQAAERDLSCSRAVGLQTAAKPCQYSDMISNRLPNNLLGSPPPIGQAEGAMPIQYSMNLRGPSFATGRSQDAPAQFSNGSPGIASTNGQVIPVAPIHSRPSLKRSAMWSPPAPRWVQRQKISGPTAHPSATYLTQAVPPIPKSAPSVSHIRWEGMDAPRQPAGQKCYICKRDLSFTSEGPVYQPAVPPAVAVLPCGHTFHDQCLQNITPEDQCKEPPCIPCAVDEN